MDSKKEEMKVTIQTSNTMITSNGGTKDKKLSKEKKSKMKIRNKRNLIRLLCMLFLTFGYFLVEIVVGYMTNSVALVADSFHMLSDVVSLIIAYIAVRMSPNKWTRNTFGWARAEVLGAMVNAVFLAALCLTIVIDAIKRFVFIEKIENPKLILIVGSVGLVVNLIGLAILHEHGHVHSESKNGGQSQKKQPKNKDPSDTASTDKTMNEGTIPNSQEDSKRSSAYQMNMRGVFLHVMADALGSVIVIISALIIWLTEWEYKMYVDPVLSLIMVILIMCSVWPLFVESALVLLQTVPNHIKIDQLKTKLLSTVNGVSQIHEFHIWSLSGDRIIASAHILCNNPEDFIRIGKEVKEFFHNEGIHSTTIQLEWAGQVKSQKPGRSTSGGESSSDSDGADTDTKSDCLLTCPFNDEDAECVSNSCCGIQKISEQTNSPDTNTPTTTTTANNATKAKQESKSKL